jgi:Tol biopolymer transport system component
MMKKTRLPTYGLSLADGNNKPRKITNTKAAESCLYMEPDNKTIAFVSKREGDEVAQIYTINIEEGGEAQRITKYLYRCCSAAMEPGWNHAIV